jgi:hypothetical protein
MSGIAKLAIAAVVGVLFGFALDRYVLPKPPPANSHRYSFRVNLTDPSPGGPFQQPTQIDLPTSWDDKMHDADAATQPPGTLQTIQVILGAPAPHQHEPGGGGGDPGAHCHGWAFIQGAWRQVHCGY